MDKRIRKPAAAHELGTDLAARANQGRRHAGSQRAGAECKMAARQSPRGPVASACPDLSG